MSFETRRIDCLVAAELSLTCGARAVRELCACRLRVLILVFILVCVLVCVLVCILVFILEVCGSGSRDDDNEMRHGRTAMSTALLATVVARTSAKAVATAMNCKSHMSAYYPDGICEIYSPSLLMMVDLECLKCSGYVVLLCRAEEKMYAHHWALYLLVMCVYRYFERC
jgi:hypothetical protein